MGKVSAIYCCDIRGGIGLKGRLPWYHKEEMDYFRSMTMGKPCLMGRRTFESLKAPLEGRDNVLISKKDDGMGLIDALSKYDKEPEVMICGGKYLYQAAEPALDRIYQSVILDAYECDTFMPSDYLDNFYEVGLTRHTGWFQRVLNRR